MTQHHVVPRAVYFTIFALLMILTLTTVLVSRVDLGALNVVVALAIAVTKATLVVLYFMHLRYAPGLTRVVVLAGLAWFAILVAFTLSDFATRGWLPILVPVRSAAS